MSDINYGDATLHIPVSGSVSARSQIAGNRDTIDGRVSVKVPISGGVYSGQKYIKQIVSGTTEYWNSQVMLISHKDVAYVYTDWSVIDGVEVPNIKVGDGKAYLIDLPFIGGAGVTPEQIEFWNNKVSVMIDPGNAENAIFYTGLTL